MSDPPLSYCSKDHLNTSSFWNNNDVLDFMEIFHLLSSLSALLEPAHLIHLQHYQNQKSGISDKPELGGPWRYRMRILAWCLLCVYYWYLPPLSSLFITLHIALCLKRASEPVEGSYITRSRSCWHSATFKMTATIQPIFA